MHKAWCSIEELPFYFFGSSIKFRGRKIDDSNPIWVRLLGWSQLSNPSDLLCWDIVHDVVATYKCAFLYIGVRMILLYSSCNSTVICNLFLLHRHEIHWLDLSKVAKGPFTSSQLIPSIARGYLRIDQMKYIYLSSYWLVIDSQLVHHCPVIWCSLFRFKLCHQIALSLLCHQIYLSVNQIRAWRY